MKTPYFFELTYSEIEEKYGQQYLLKYLYPELKIGKNHSPLRRDEDPSFLIGVNTNGTIYWKDQRTGLSGNLYTLIIEREPSVSNFPEAIYFINRQLQRLNIQPIDKASLSAIKTKQFKLGVVRRQWLQHDIDYWAQFGISKKTLELYNVSPIEWIYLNPNTKYETVIVADKFSYVFKETKDSLVTLKVYQPFSTTAKWFSDCTEQISAWHGWVQMDKNADVLIWTKSLKDVMSIRETTGFNSVSLQAESWMPKVSVVNELKQRFRQIYLLYDNDLNSEQNWGRNLGAKIANTFDIKQIEIPDLFNCKDYSQLYQNYQEQALQILNGLL